MGKAGKFIPPDTVKSVGRAGGWHSAGNPAAGKAPHAAVPRRTVSPKTRTSKNRRTGKRNTAVPRADRRVTCRVCGKRMKFHLLSHHKSRSHPDAARRSAKIAAQNRAKKAAEKTLAIKTAQASTTKLDPDSVKALLEGWKNLKGK